MACIKNKVRFLFWRVNGPHVEEVIRVGKFMLSASFDDTFVVKYRCKKCGAIRKDSFVTHERLLELGLNNDEIEKAATIEF